MLQPMKKQEQEKGTEAPTEGAVSPEVTPEQEEKKEDKPKKGCITLPLKILT